jgi:UDPglucose 6-dehydrogenase
MRIVIVGAGVVGAATGKGFARRGHAVTFVDVDVSRVDQLRADGYAATAELDLRGPSALVMLSVPTPAGPDGYELGALKRATTAVGEAVRSAEEMPTVILRSTVAPGTCERVVQPILEDRSGLAAGDGFAVASNPEFLRAESALEDFLSPWMTVVASRSKRTRERLTELYRPFGGMLRTFADPATAELAKIVHNLFNAAKISFWNEIWMVAQQIGVDADDVAQTVARSAEASWNPAYGTRGGRPFGGACLPKDTRGFVSFAQELGLQIPMAEAVERVNQLVAEVDHGLTVDLRERAAALNPTVPPSTGR